MTEHVRSNGQIVDEHKRTGKGWLKVKRLRLTRGDGKVYLDRWGFRCPLFGLFLHRMEAPDPGLDLHDHPWWFASIVLRGGYTEHRNLSRDAPLWSEIAEEAADRGKKPFARGWRVARPARSVKTMRLDECHRIVSLDRTPTWTLVITGPIRRRWGFYLPTGFVDDAVYDTLHRHDLKRRDVSVETGP